MTAQDFHYEVFDGRGIATVWTVTRRRTTDILGECVGTVYGVHTTVEAHAAWMAELELAQAARVAS